MCTKYFDWLDMNFIYKKLILLKYTLYAMLTLLWLIYTIQLFINNTCCICKGFKDVENVVIIDNLLISVFPISDFLNLKKTAHAMLSFLLHLSNFDSYRICLFLSINYLKYNYLNKNILLMCYKKLKNTYYINTWKK